MLPLHLLLWPILCFLLVFAIPVVIICFSPFPQPPPCFLPPHPSLHLPSFTPVNNFYPQAWKQASKPNKQKLKKVSIQSIFLFPSSIPVPLLPHWPLYWRHISFDHHLSYPYGFSQSPTPSLSLAMSDCQCSQVTLCAFSTSPLVDLLYLWHCLFSFLDKTYYFSL